MRATLSPTYFCHFQRILILLYRFSTEMFKLSSNLFLISDDKSGTLDGALDNLYCRSQMYLSRQMSRLHPELTMPIFSGFFFISLINLFQQVSI